MTVVTSEQFGADRIDSENEDQEHAAHDRNTTVKLGDIDQAVSAFEGEIREFVRRDAGAQRRQHVPEPAADASAENMNSLIQRVSGASMEEIDRVISELQSVREMLRSEGERVSREIAGYASLSHTAMTAMKVIGESVTQWKSAPARDAEAAE